MAARQRVIFHIDCNGFYASVEEVLHPELKQVPMAVCGNPESRRGIILAKNELAKGFGVKTAETIWQAKEKCPVLVLAPARHHLYREYSRRINAIYAQYTDQVQPFGLDESFLDVTGSLHLFGGDAVALAQQIRERIPRETGITVSVGVSFNKIFAKLGSDLKKPNAVTVITRENYRQIVWPLPVNALLMVGKSTEQTLWQMRIRTVGELAASDPALLRQRLGKLGEQLYLHANGRDDEPVLRLDEQPPLHSVGNGLTFKRNLLTQADIRTAVTALSDSVAARLRKAGLKGQALQITVKDTNFQVISRQKQLDRPSWLAADLAREALALLARHWPPGKPIRMLTITALKPLPADQVVEQPSLFVEADQTQEKQEKLAQTIDQIRAKFGPQSITLGSLVENDLGINEDYGQE